MIRTSSKQIRMVIGQFSIPPSCMPIARHFRLVDMQPLLTPHLARRQKNPLAACGPGQKLWNQAWSPAAVKYIQDWSSLPLA